MALVTGTGLFDAVALAGTGFLFNSFNHSGYKDAEEFREKLTDGNVDIRETNKALQLLSTQLYEHMESETKIDDWLSEDGCLGQLWI